MRLRSPWTPYLSDRFVLPADRLVGALADDILQGRLDGGARLPAHRDLADRLGIGVGTVTKAYAILERRGLVRTVKGGGTFVALTQSRTGEVIDLSRNVPPAALTERLLARTLAALSRRVDAGFFNDYPPLGGHAEHRRLLARWFASIGMQADPDLLLLTSGARHALSLAFSIACGKGGTLVTEMQTYPGALALARYHGLEVVGVPLDGEGILPDALDATLRALHGKRAALCVTPTMHNPTTATMSRSRREAVVAVCRAHDIEIVEDDVYNLGIDAQSLPLAMLAPERTFYANSLAKSLNPTLGIGGLVVPRAALARAESMIRATSILVSPLSCAVMEQWLLDGTAEDVRAAIRAESARRVALAAAALAGRARVPGHPGHHLWMPMALDDALRLQEEAATFGILLTPPAATATDPASRDSGIRICTGAVSPADLASAVTTIARLRHDAAADVDKADAALS